MPQEMHGVCLSLQDKISVGSNILVLSVVLAQYYFYEEVGNTLCALSKASSQHKNTYILIAAVDAIVSKNTKHNSETMREGGCVLFPFYAFIVLQEQEAGCFLCF